MSWKEYKFNNFYIYFKARISMLITKSIMSLRMEEKYGENDAVPDEDPASVFFTSNIEVL